MRRLMMKPALLCAALAAAILVTSPAVAAPVRTAHLSAELVAAQSGAAPGSTVWLAAIQTIDKGWHTYWRNPGDAGEATTLAWSLPANWRAGPIVWPPPARFALGPIMNYGYGGTVVLAVPVHVPSTATIGQSAQIRVRMDFLVCADVCVPGSADLGLALPVTARPAPDPKWGPQIERALARAPEPGALQAAFGLQHGQMALAVTGPGFVGAAVRDAYFYPYDDQLIVQSAPERIDLGVHGLTIFLTPSAGLARSVAPARVGGVLEVDGRAFEIAATPGPAPPGTAGLGPPRKPAGSLVLPLAAALAFAGGLVLNLMPCVFPVLSMKAAGLVQLGEQPRRARAEGLAFTAGVLASFVALAAALIGLRAAGAAVGWGFQLQSPTVVALLALVTLAAALNLSGLFEVGADLQGLGARPAGGGTLGAALTGILAVVVAAPCTAPFMGPALGWALTQPPLPAASVFVALGLGFAAPFALLSFSPGALRRLPRPGPWMETFRRAMAFAMYAAAAWLAWVLTRQSGAGGLARLLAAAVSLAFAAWLFGMAQQRRAIGRRAGPLAAVAAAGVVLSLALAADAGAAGLIPASLRGSSPAPQLAAQPYSPARLDLLRAQGRPVFVNFTAAWCVTCQVNERLALSSPEVASAFRRAGAAYLVADWTRRDATIARALAEHGRIGVPLYLVYGAAGQAPQILPQILTPDAVVRAIQAAAVRSAAGSAVR